MRSKLFWLFWGWIVLLPLAFAGCSGGMGGASGSSSGTVGMMVSDAPESDWAAVDVRILSIALNPAGGGAPMTVYTAPSGGVVLNLVQLDQLNEILGNAGVPAGSYTSATLTLSANPGDVVLIPSDNPDPGFAGASLPPATPIPAANVQIQGATGSSGSMTVPLTVKFVSPEVVSAGGFTAVDLEFDLAHPAFLIAHVPPAAGTIEWAVNFNGPVRHRIVHDIRRLVLRDLYGTVVSFTGTNDSGMLIIRDFPVEPPTNPETPVATTRQLTIQADAANGTLFYNLDNPVTPTPVLMNFSSVAALLTSSTYYVRIAARYQVDGSLVAVRIWASTSFDKVWENPEGHVLHVNTSTNLLTVEKENGGHVDLQVTGATEFYFRTPANAVADATPIGTGTAFLSNLKRGFKVHVLANPLVAPPQAVTVDIEIARFDGNIVDPTTSGFGYTRVFANANDSYTDFPVTYIPNSMANGYDPPSGAAISGFKWWNFAFPTAVTSNVTVGSATQAIADFVSTAGNSVNFGGSVGILPAYGQSGAVWMTGTPGNWSVPYVILLPSAVPLTSVSSGWINVTGGGEFTMVAPALATPGSGTPPVTPVTVDATTTAGSATVVYQVDRQSNGIITISPEDISTTAGLNTVIAALQPGTVVKAFGLPELSGHLKAYVFFYFTGTVPVS